MNDEKNKFVEEHCRERSITDDKIAELARPLIAGSTDDSGRFYPNTLIFILSRIGNFALPSL